MGVTCTPHNPPPGNGNSILENKLHGSTFGVRTYKPHVSLSIMESSPTLRKGLQVAKSRRSCPGLSVLHPRPAPSRHGTTASGGSMRNSNLWGGRYETRAVSFHFSGQGARGCSRRLLPTHAPDVRADRLGHFAHNGLLAHDLVLVEYGVRLLGL